jgi:hypothetical protein
MQGTKTFVAFDFALISYLLAKEVIVSIYFLK